MRENHMRRSHAFAASAATAIVMLSACGDNTETPAAAGESPPATSGPTVDDTTTLADAEGVELVGNSGLGHQTLSVSVKEQGGTVTGEFRISDNVTRVDCASTDTDGFVIVGGEATKGPDVTPGDRLALIIREGRPDSVWLYGDSGASSSCAELIGSIPSALLSDDSNFVDVEDGYDIVTD
jgi:hypothetical protein